MGGKTRQVRRILFPEKLWDLVNRVGTGVQWSKDGTCIEVERNQLEKSFEGKFRSRNFDSFIRQLHFYGFRKAGNSYHHEKFQQNRYEAVLTMKRKYSTMVLEPLTSDNIDTTQVAPKVVEAEDIRPNVQAAPLDLRVMKSPSKTLRKNQQYIIVKVGSS